MFENEKDFTSRLLSISTNVLMFDTPRRTTYGVILGFFLQVLSEFIAWLGVNPPFLSTFQYVIIGVIILHFRTLLSMIFRKRKLSEKYEEQFAVINEAEAKGLSKAHIKIQLLQICQLALKEASLEQKIQDELNKLEKDAKEE